MHHNGLRLHTIMGIWLTITLLGVAPVLATHKIEHAEQQIATIVGQADDAMAAIVDQFAADAPAAMTVTELEDIEDAAKHAIDSIKDDAARDLDAIKKAYPELGAATQEAKSDVVTLRNAAKTLIKDIADSTIPPGIPTTTAPPDTTTTTTAPPNTATTTTPQSTVITTAPANTGPTAAPPLPTTTAAPSLIGSAGGFSRPLDASAGALDPTLKPLPDRAANENSSGSRAGGLTGTLTNGLSVVVPPGIATAVLSPLIVFEVLLQTLLSSARSLVLPSLLLLISWVLLMPRRSKRSSAAPVGSEA